MDRFVIKKIIAKGDNVLESSICFEEGLNIVCGPSNTGKSYIFYCIDYMFGSSTKPFDESTGYDTIIMEVVTKDGDSIRLEREIGKNTVNVISHSPEVESGKYNTSRGNQRLSDLWLSLIGIRDEHKIIKNQYYHPQMLTWRTFIHTILINDDAVSQRESILAKAGYYERTSSLTALLFLMSSKDYSEFSTQDTPEIKKARKKAKSDYINEKLQELSEQHGRIADSMIPLEGINIESEMQKVIDRITETENEIIIATNRSRRLLEQIYDISAKLEEGRFLHDRYMALDSQYQSDIRRLQFIDDGGMLLQSSPTVTRCPVCDSELTDEGETHQHDTKGEIKIINAKLLDLREVIDDVADDKVQLEGRLGELKAENEDVLAVIRNKLEPQAEELKERLNDYRVVVQMRHEMDVIKALSVGMNNDLGVIEQDDESELRFKPKEHFSSEFIETMSNYLSEMLENSKFERFLTARFSIDSFDVVTNGRKKETEGSGFRAFLNTVLAFSFMRYLANHGKYTPGLLVIDSPILSLKERDGEKATDSMKASLFRYLLSNQQYGQVILLENDIPEIDYNKANVIEFTMDDEDGRYGFLLSVRN
ncbi:MAG: hypothetical protein FWG21_01675 [Oscillospiraceae bacterium]|nr:hypothetical protein [Oscillospiraceae bacterium]